MPESPEVYVHRTGRTGRAGKKGTALSLVGPRELGNFRYVRLQFGIKPEERLLPKDDDLHRQAQGAAAADRRCRSRPTRSRS